mmetsp:Transcript_19828/g.46543  ORF Transcript_19828/g.46543 Transcript_19828/m.46543 type:complete len:499 (+) Transcript_19828:143-1639(+)
MLSLSGSTPLGTLLRIEAAMSILRSSKGNSSTPADDFYSMARSHEWLATRNGANVKQTNVADLPHGITSLAEDVGDLASKLSEEERLLFDFVVVASWQTGKSYLQPLYRLSSSNSKLYVETLDVSSKPSRPASKKSMTRSDVLGYRYHFSLKHCSFEAGGDSLRTWWEHAQRVVNILLSHRDDELVLDGVARKSTFHKFIADGNKKAEDDIEKDGRKLTLEERIRARSRRNNPSASLNEKNKPAKPDPKAIERAESRALLELADSLRSYSQRKSGGTALDRLLNRGSTGDASLHQTSNHTSRLPASDLLRSARSSWNVLVSEDSNLNGRTGKMRQGASSGSIDVSHALYQLRIVMGLDKRQMEIKLTELLERLASLAPEFVQLRQAPSAVMSLGTKRKVDGSSCAKAQGTNAKSIRRSIVVIRTDALNYSEVRARLGGRVMHDACKDSVEVLSLKRRRTSAKKPAETLKGPSSVAESIVPPSFLKFYGRALERDGKRS